MLDPSRRKGRGRADQAAARFGGCACRGPDQGVLLLPANGDGGRVVEATSSPACLLVTLCGHHPPRSFTAPGCIGVWPRLPVPEAEDSHTRRTKRLTPTPRSSQSFRVAIRR